LSLAEYWKLLQNQYKVAIVWFDLAGFKISSYFTNEIFLTQQH